MVAAAPKAEEDRGGCLESYRVDVTGRAWPILVPATMLTSVGAFVVCTSFVVRGVLMHHPGLTFFGTACMVMGPVLAVYGMRGLLTVDEYVAVLERGVLVHVAGTGAGRDLFLPWGEITRVRWDETEKAIVVERREAAAVRLLRPFARTTNEKLAARLDELRRKAGFNLIA